MESIDGLRKYAGKLSNGSGPWNWIARDLFSIADVIEREVGEMQRALTIDAKPMTDENMAESGWVRLPVDADGEPWHVGDMTENGNVVNGMTINFHGWHFTGTRNDIDPAIHRHYAPKPTVEDVLREFYTLAVRGKAAHAEDVDNAVLAEYAAKLRLAEDNNCLYEWERDEQ